MSKFEGKNCYLCGNVIMTHADGDHDHIPPRNIFPTKISGNLITVPTHKSCNNDFSKYDEPFRNYLTSCCYDKEKAKEVYQTKVKKSFDGPIGNKKRQLFLSKVRDEIMTDEKELIKGPLFLIEEDNPCLVPQFKRIIKGLYCHKLKKPLPSCAFLEVYFKDIHDFNKINFEPQWKEVEKDVFRYFFYTQQGDDVKGISGLIFYEKIFCLGFFGL